VKTTIDDFRRDKIAGVLARDDWAIISAFVPCLPFVDKGVWVDVMHGRTNVLRHNLIADGHQTWEVTGRYEGERELSILVLGITPLAALVYGRQFGQRTVLVGRGLLDCEAGCVLEGARAVGIEVLHTDNPTGDYSRIHATQTCFRVRFADEQAPLGSSTTIELAEAA
jgi:hypothetical protein